MQGASMRTLIQSGKHIIRFQGGTFQVYRLVRNRFGDVISEVHVESYGAFSPAIRKLVQQSKQVSENKRNGKYPMEL